MAKWKTTTKAELERKATKGSKARATTPAEFYIDPVTGYKITVCKPVASPKLRTANC